MASLIGRNIGPYEIRDLIGRGGMAEVYRAYQPSLNRYVAIKVLPAELAEDGQFIQRFKQEALATGNLRHPNILPVHDAGMFEGQPYMVMDYLPGGTLADRLQTGPLSPDVAADMGAQIADALDHAHRRGIVHRDLKPSNVLLDEDGRPVLADFGIAQAITEGARLTLTGTAVGTPEYMSPEQTQGTRVDGRSDIYSLGIVLYQMLTGNVPFHASTPVATLYQVVNQPPVPPRVFNAAAPPFLESIIMRALAKRPEERFQTAKEMADALRSQKSPSGAAGVSAEAGAATVIMGKGTRAPATRPSGAAPTRPVSPPQKAGGSGLRGLLIALIALAMLALVAVGAMLVLRIAPLGAGTPQAAAPGAAAITPAATTAEPPAAGSPTPLQAAGASTVQPSDTPSPTASPEPATSAVPDATDVVATATPTPAPPTPASPTPAPATSEPSPTLAPPTVAPAATAAPASAASRGAAGPGVLFDFETFGTWRRGDQPYGTFEQTTELKHDGNAAGKLSYNFPAVADNYVVFTARPPIPLPGDPHALTLWVYGDGSNHFLNAWIQDSAGQMRQFNFGRVTHKDAWQPMTAVLDTSLPWPQQHIGGPDTPQLSYPISLAALVLDGQGSTGPSQGTIYLDGLTAGQAAATSAGPAAPVPASTSAPATQAVAIAAPVTGRIVFTQNNGGRVDLMAVDAATGRTWTVAPNAAQPRMRADGRVVYNGTGGAKNDLITVMADGSGESIIGKHPEDAYPDWSPTGQSVVFYSTFGPGQREQVYIQRNATRAEDPGPLQINGQNVLGGLPTWLKDGRIAYSGCDYWSSGSHCGIWAMNSDGSGNPLQLTQRMDDHSTDSAPGVLLFASSASGNWEVYAINPGGGESRNLTNSPSQDFGGAFSPDGRSIAFGSDRDGWGIWIMNADGTNPRRLIAVPGGFGPKWPEERLSWGP